MRWARSLTVVPPLPLAASLLRQGPAADPLPFPLEDPRRRVYAGPIEAIRAGAGALGLGPGDEVLVPGGPAGGLLRAAGVACRTYAGGERMAPVEDELDAMCGPRVRALLLVHHLGFPQDMARWRRWCDGRALMLLEDARDAWLSTRGGRPAGSAGDLAVLFPARTLGIPAGALLVSRAPPDPNAGRGPLAPLAEPLIRRLADPHVAAVRRANYGVLVDALGDLVPPSYRELPAGASPLALPVTASLRDPLHGRLAAAGIRPLDLGAPLVGLPVHQGLRERDLGTIARAAAPPGRRRPEPAVSRVESPGELAEEWTRLAVQTQNVFSTWEFASAWWRHFGGAGELRVHAVRDADGRLLAILPLHRSTVHGLPIAGFLGHGVADQLGPVCAAGDRAATARALRRLLGERALGSDILLGHRIAADEGWDALLGARVLRRETSPTLDVAGRDWESFLRECSANLRQQVRGRERKLAREHDLRLRLVDSPAQLPDAMERLFELHEARWGGTSSAFEGARRAFHADFAAAALRRGWLRLWLAELDGVVAAAWYGFRFAGVESYYQSGRDPAHERANVGFVLLAHTIREAIADGQSEYRFLRGPEPYKRRFANRDAPVDTVVMARGAPSAALVAAIRAAVRVPAARRAIARAAG